MESNPAANPLERTGECPAPTAGGLPSRSSPSSELQKIKNLGLAIAECLLSPVRVYRCIGETVARESKAHERRSCRVLSRPSALYSPPNVKSMRSLAAIAPESHATVDISLLCSHIAIRQSERALVRISYDKASNEPG